MAVYQLNEHRPSLAADVWVAESAEVIGRVTLNEGASVWFGAVLRGDSDEIIVGTGSNVQDHAVLHCDPGVPLHIGARVTVGHRAVLHGCTIGDGVLVGIGAVVLNRAVIGEGCVIGAGALVTEGKVFAPYSLIIGSPAQAVKTLTPEQAHQFQRGAAHYRDNAQLYRYGLKKLDLPSTEHVEPF